MICINQAEKTGLSVDDYRTFLKLLAPFAPHLTEELWEAGGGSDSVHTEAWPIAEQALLIDETAVISVQINGKMRGTITVPRDAAESDVVDTVRNDSTLGARITGEITKVIYVPGRIINLMQNE